MRRGEKELFMISDYMVLKPVKHGNLPHAMELSGRAVLLLRRGLFQTN